MYSTPFSKRPVQRGEEVVVVGGDEQPRVQPREDSLPVARRDLATGDAGQLDEQRLQPAETAGRLGQPVEMRGGGPHGFGIERTDPGERGRQRPPVLLGVVNEAGHAAGPLSVSGSPATRRPSSTPYSISGDGLAGWAAIPPRSHWRP